MKPKILSLEESCYFNLLKAPHTINISFFDSTDRFKNKFFH